jgi:hypothetical protein
LCGRLRQLDLDLGLPPMIFGPPFAAAVAFPNRVGADSDAPFLVAHSIDPDQRRPTFPCKADATFTLESYSPKRSAGLTQDKKLRETIATHRGNRSTLTATTVGQCLRGVSRR